MQWLVEPFQYEFFRTGIAVAMLAGALCGLLGVYIVLRGMSYIGHGLSHAIFGGAVVSFVMQWNFYLGAGLWGFLTAVLINQTARRTRIGADAAIGVITTASFAVGVALISRYRRFTQSFDAALFGNILGVTWDEVAVVAGITVLVAAVILVAYKQLLFTTFDAEVAQVYGVRTQWIDTLFALALAAAIIASMQVLGVTLIAAALVIPAITARLLTDSFDRMMLYAVTIGVLCGALGMYVSFYVDIASGATIVLLQSTFFVFALIVSGLRHQAGRRLAHVHVD
ncbi:MAG: metal ABC transporter permease [Caldilinea sp.]|nr:metal ABC transporter permease [Caldilinea sp.]MCB9114290.1 metal ABC transporter permease [Caldilineaceae bacterium]MCB9125075.1 metal ABC transporter permease [Caldilineaceae bacterium]MCO5214239.1 metal ABC transporter permease [Caldilinea sp.]MCW5844334.1 metal ABC transporter permease [Caldilinea sp.]